MLHTSGGLVVRTASVESQDALKETQHSAALFYIPNQGVRMTMQGDFEYLLEENGLNHINTQIQRRSERQGRTLGFKDSNLNNLVMLNCDR